LFPLKDGEKLVMVPVHGDQILKALIVSGSDCLTKLVTSLGANNTSIAHNALVHDNSVPDGNNASTLSQDKTIFKGTVSVLAKSSGLFPIYPSFSSLNNVHDLY